MFRGWYELKLPEEYGVIWKHLSAYGKFFEIQWTELATYNTQGEKNVSIHSDFQVFYRMGDR